MVDPLVDVAARLFASLEMTEVGVVDVAGTVGDGFQEPAFDLEMVDDLGKVGVEGWDIG
jgi:hypothetical protein